MHDYLGTPAGHQMGALTPNMVPASPASTCSGEEHITLADIRADLRCMSAEMVTKEDLNRASDTLHAALKAEVAGIRADITLHDALITAMEQRTENAEGRTKATDTAIKRQGDLLLAMRR
ncbi:Hypothetical predicted protein [Pelobates cultripes]|uniref:Uncharacterized protein n=1 Tax=Pelobates cultripes TaxID=61616 RepID=A0AAD1SIW3_PELCU|nr:Hypothetical predicted protein [Pelobates cultripes]